MPNSPTAVLFQQHCCHKIHVLFLKHIYFCSKVGRSLINPLAYSAAQKRAKVLKINEIQGSCSAQSLLCRAASVMESRHLFSRGLTRGRLLEYFSNAAQCTSCYQKHWAATVSLAGSGCHCQSPLSAAHWTASHATDCDSPGRRNEPYLMWCFLPRLPLGLQWVFLLQTVLRWLIPIRYISTGVTSMMNGPAAKYTCIQCIYIERGRVWIDYWVSLPCKHLLDFLWLFSIC